MPNWKKVIVSGSVAHLSHVSSSGDFKTDKTGSFGRIETDGQVVLQRDPVQGFNYLARQAQGEVSASAKAHTFTALAASKTSNHPYKNLGSSLGYVIDGVETPYLYLTEGHYKFDYSGASSHPVRFYFDAAKTTQYNPSSHVSVDGNVITLKIDKDSPQIIYYQCSSHGYMGWAIHTGQNSQGQDENGMRTLLSGSAQISSDISGSFTSVSSSIATDITEFKDGTVTLVSGSGVSTGSFGRVQTSGNVSVGDRLLLSRNQIQGFNYLGRLSTGRVASPSSAHTFTVAAHTKTTNHPYHSSGSSNGYLIDGVETPFLYLTEGIYKFDYSAATSHPVRFYFDAAKTTQYAPSSHVSVDGNVIQLKIDKDSPQILYYQCSQHGFMGWAIHTGQNPLGQDANGLRTLFSGSAQITHDDTTGFVANEHIDHSGVSITAGTGLTGGGNITSTRTLAIDFTDSTFKSAVSGSITSVSSSISTRLTTAESELNNTLVSSSAQIADDISGSFTAASSSFSSRTTTLESASGSDSTRITTLEGRVNQGVKTTDSPTFAGATINGTLIASEIHTTFFSSSVTVATGSNTFGDSISDKHEFTGSIVASGSVTATSFTGVFNGVLSGSAQISDAISGSFTATSASISTRLTTAESELDNTLISSSAQISSDISGSFTSVSSSIATDITEFKDGTVTLVSGSGVSTGSFGRVEVHDKLSIRGFSDVSSSLAAAVAGGDNLGNHTATQDLNLNGNDIISVDNITTTGNVSGSSTSTGSFGVIEVGGGHFTSASLAAGGSGGGGSSFTATGISGSFTSVSKSIATDITEFKDGTVTLVSGSGVSTGSFGRVEATKFSGDGSGLSNIAASITVKDEGSNLTTEVSSVNFVGDNVVASTDGNDVTVTLNNTNSTGDAKVINVSSAATTWAVTHSLSTKYPVVTVWDDSDRVIIPDSITADTTNTATITFEQPMSGRASFTLGVPSGSFFVSASNQILTTVADSTIDGDLTLTGTLTSREVHTLFVSSSVMTTTGSNVFGDDISDTHRFTGSIVTSGSVTATSFTGVFNGALSGSGQISSDISGSFTAASSSFSTRLTTAESELDNTLISSSAQIANDISGSLGGNADLIRSLTATSITGSFTAVSSSVASRLDNLANDIIALSIALG